MRLRNLRESTALSGLRAFALDKNIVLGVIVLLLSMVPFGINMVYQPLSHYIQETDIDVSQVEVVDTSGFVDPVFGCVSTSTVGDTLGRK